MAIADPLVRTRTVAPTDQGAPPYLRTDVSGNPPDGGVAAMIGASDFRDQLAGGPRGVLLNLSALWSFAIPHDVEWLRTAFLPMLDGAGVERAVIVAAANVHGWALHPWERQLAEGKPSALCLPCSWHVDEFFASGRRCEDAEGEWLGQAEAWLRGA